MKVYVAAPAVERDLAVRIMDMVRGYGHEITFDWAGEEADIRPHWRGQRDEGRTHAEKERSGVKEAGLLILVLPSEKYKERGLGAYIEFGMAAGQNKTIWVVGFEDFSRDSIFFCLPEVHLLTLEEADAALRMARDTELANEAEQRARDARDRTTARLLYGDL